MVIGDEFVTVKQLKDYSDSFEAPTVDISVGNVTTLQAGADATVTNTGSEGNAVFNFGIPRGEKGDKGETGEQGPQGPQGPRGYDGSDATADPLDAWPVGSVYISYNSTSPSSRFGGSWRQINGYFPYFGSGTSTGGSNTKTLSLSNMPRHRHDILCADMGGTGGTTYKVVYGGRNSTPGRDYTEYQGSGSSFNIMPEYQTLYAWRRTS